MCNNGPVPKIVHVITSLEMGGAQAVLYDLITHLDTKIGNHEIIYMHDGPYKNLFEQAHIPLHRLTGIISPYDPTAYYRLIKLIKKIKPTCLHTLLWSANWLGRLAAWQLGIRCINSLHNNVDQNGVMRTLLDMITPAPQELIAVSQQVKDSYRQLHPISCPITIITNGIDAAKMHAIAHEKGLKRTDIGYADHHIVIGSVGRFQPVKQLPLLLKTFNLLHAENNRIRLLLVGSGPQEGELRDYAHMLGIDQVVHFATNQRAYSYYPLMDIFVLASEKEGISIALLEAMSIGIPPLVRSPNAIHPVVIHRKNGLVANSGNATDFTKSLRILVNSSTLRKILGYAAQRSIHTSFSINAMVASYEKVFHRKTCPTHRTL